MQAQDGKRKDKLGTLVFIDNITHEVLIWKHIKTEKASDYKQFDYSFSVGINRKQIEELATLTFIKRNENIILLGQCGVGYVKYYDM